jgi:hypothetical protein
VKPRLSVLLLLIFLLPAIYEGCSKEEYLPGLTGKMVGYIYTFDEFGKVLEDHSNVKITAIGLDRSFSGYSEQNGRFVLEELPTGTYELHFKKSGFGLLKQFGVQHLGGKPTILPRSDSDEHAYFLYEIPETTISDLAVIDDSVSVDLSFTTAEPPDHIRIRFYFSSAAGFSSLQAEYTDNRYLRIVNGSYFGTLDFQNAPFEPGETVYVVACCIAEVGSFNLPLQSYRAIYGVDTYFDYENNKTIYPGLGDESDPYSFIFPE